MDKFNYVFQINTGSFTNRHYSEQSLSENIKRLFSFIQAEKVILGWFPDPLMYRNVVNLIHSLKSEAYLWLPVFADIMPSLGIQGKSEVTQTASEDEHFEFIPPETGTKHVITQYETVAGDAGFDGVFLDRIRYGTPLEDSGRITKITKAAHTLVDYFHSKSLKAGMDLFAPHLAPYLGQDSLSLGMMSDFIKPMMYWTTNAPAGIPYEEEVFKKRIDKIPKYSDVLLTNLTSKCNVYPGIEVNNIPGICSTTEDYVSEKIEYFKSCNCKGAVLSWNSADATDEMLSTLKVLSES